MATTIVTKNSSTASAVPTAAQLVQGELAVNVADKRIYTENNAGAVVELGTNPSTLTVTGEITANGGIALGDNDKATFGDSDDLRIYHDGGNSLIEESGVGNLVIRGSGNVDIQPSGGGAYMARFAASGASSLYYNGAEKLATTATGIDVTGTATMDGLSLDNAQYINFKNSSNVSTRSLGINGANTFYIGGIDADIGDILFVDGGTTRASFANGGDISFYEDTGTTPKFFWDASAESLGIGTTSPSNTVTVNSTAGAGIKVYGADQAHSRIAIDNLNGQEWNLVAGTAGSSNSGFGIYDVDAGATRLQIDSSGNVGIQSTDPTNNSVGGVGGLVIGNGTGNKGLTLFGSSTAQQNIAFTDTSNSQQGLIQYDHGGDYMRLFTSSSERMRIDSSGNVLAGKSTTAFNTSGVELRPNGAIWATVIGQGAASFNIKGTDGVITDFYRDGSPVGSIGAEGGDLVIGTGSTAGLQFNDATPTVRPWNMSANSRTDGVCDLGYSNARFKDLYLSGGVYLGGTGAANKLEDYEEGTFTPTVIGSTTTGTATYSHQKGVYTKIGNVVTIQIYLNWSSGTGAGVLRFSNLPFTLYATSGFYSSATIGEYSNIAGTAGHTLCAIGLPNTVDIQFAENDFSSAPTTTAYDAEGYIILTMTYLAA